MLTGNDSTMKKYQFYCFKTNMTTVEEVGLHAYEPMLGGPFTCLLTQFMYALATKPAGILVWGLIATLLFPVTLLMYGEAGRYGAKGLVRWPILVLFLGQLLGISTTFPAMWLPAAFRGQGTGATSKGRVWMAMFLVVPITLVEIYIFFGNPATRSWTLCAGLLTGPGIPFLGILLWPFPAPGSEKSEGAVQAIKLLKGAYRFFMLPSAAGYYFLVYRAYMIFDTPKELLESLWGPKADASVMFMTVDSVVLALALILYLIMNCSCLDVFFTLVASPFIGPAAAICAALGQREAKRVAQWSGEGHQALLA